MTKLEDRIAEAERKRSLVDRYAPIVDAAGYLDGNIQLTPEDAFFLASVIIHDKEVARLGRLPEFAHRNGNVVDPDYVAVIESMDGEEREALRARVNFHPIPVTRGGASR